jgi:hypothetical protein
LVDEAALIDGCNNFKRIAAAIRALATKTEKDDGWSDSTLRAHTKEWRKSKDGAG